MKPVILRRFAYLFVIAVVSLISFGFITTFGLDSYEIYLNKQLLLKQSVNQPVDLRKLSLNKANETDQLRIRYRHCQAPYTGTGRTILIQDPKGNTLRKWVFASDGAPLMTIPVREILQLEQKHASQTLSLHYISKELSKAETLAFIH